MQNIQTLIGKVHNEDCMATMQRIPDCTVDLVITSPPYNKAGYEGFIRKRHDGDTWKARNIDYGDDPDNDFMPEDEYQNQQINFLNELHRIIKPDGSIFYNHKIRIAQHKASHPIEWILKSNLTFRQQIIWDRKGGPARAPIRYMPSTELIFWLTKTPCQPNFQRNEKSLFYGEVWAFPARSNPMHPAPFPPELPMNIMMSIKEKGDDYTVYDPYAGSGTTLKAAKSFGLNYFGSEINSKYCAIANNSINSLLF